MLINISHPGNSRHFGRVIESVMNAEFLDPDWTTSYIYNFSIEEQIGKK